MCGPPAVSSGFFGQDRVAGRLLEHDECRLLTPGRDHPVEKVNTRETNARRCTCFLTGGTV